MKASLTVRAMKDMGGDPNIISNTRLMSTGCKVNIIAACSSRGRIWMTVNHGNNNTETILSFIFRLCKLLQDEDPEWRNHYRILLDNASYHRSNDAMAMYKELKIPVMFLGPYSFDCAAVEKVFCMIKKQDLNKEKRSFNSRKSYHQYVEWLAEELSKLDIGYCQRLFAHTLKFAQRYANFENI